MKLIPFSLLSAIAIVGLFVAGARSNANDPLIARGRYLVGFGSCNDCHTPGWRDSDGKIPAAKWMTGSTFGYRGPWGTSYATNVRLDFQALSEDQWLFMVRTRGGHWPMVWHDLRMLDITDQRAIYRFIRSLGSRGTQVPAALPPSVEPSTPYMWVLPEKPNNPTPKP
jgi:hypothetical protein